MPKWDILLHYIRIGDQAKAVKFIKNTSKSDLVKLGQECKTLRCDESPIHYSAYLNLSDVVKALLEGHLDLSLIKDSSGQDLVDYAYVYGSHQTQEVIAKVVLNKPDVQGHTCLHNEVFEVINHPSRSEGTDALRHLKELLELGASPSAQDNFGNIPLHYAVRSNNKEIVNLLIHYDQNSPDVANHKGITPLKLASIFHRIEILELLNDALNGVFHKELPPSSILDSDEISHFYDIGDKVTPTLYGEDLKLSVIFDKGIRHQWFKSNNLEEINYLRELMMMKPLIVAIPKGYFDSELLHKLKNTNFSSLDSNSPGQHHSQSQVVLKFGKIGLETAELVKSFELNDIEKNGDEFSKSEIIGNNLTVNDIDFIVL